MTELNMTIFKYHFNYLGNLLYLDDALSIQQNTYGILYSYECMCMGAERSKNNVDWTQRGLRA